MAQAIWIRSIDFNAEFRNSAGTLVVKHNVNKNDLQQHTSSNVAKECPYLPSRAN